MLDLTLYSYMLGLGKGVRPTSEKSGQQLSVQKLIDSLVICRFEVFIHWKWKCFIFLNKLLAELRREYSYQRGPGHSVNNLNRQESTSSADIQLNILIISSLRVSPEVISDLLIILLFYRHCHCSYLTFYTHLYDFGRTAEFSHHYKHYPRPGHSEVAYHLVRVEKDLLCLNH